MSEWLYDAGSWWLTNWLIWDHSTVLQSTERIPP